MIFGGTELNSFEMAKLRRQGRSSKEVAELAGLTEEEVAKQLEDYAKLVYSANTKSAVWQTFRDKERHPTNAARASMWVVEYDDGNTDVFSADLPIDVVIQIADKHFHGKVINIERS